MNGIQKPEAKIPQPFLDLVNQVFDIERKAAQLKEPNSIQRNVNRLKDLIENEIFKTGQTIGVSYQNPIGENYSDTRTDVEASISGSSAENLEIVEVIRPIVYVSHLADEKVIKSIVQKGIVVVESKET